MISQTHYDLLMVAIYKGKPMQIGERYKDSTITWKKISPTKALAYLLSNSDEQLIRVKPSNWQDTTK